MKKISTLISIILFSFSLVSAQGNLQFNQVLTYGGNLSANGYNQQLDESSPTWIVPQDKVWKIEHKTRTAKVMPLRFLVNNTPVWDMYEKTIWLGSSASNSMVVDNSPIWLKSGDILKFNCNIWAGTNSSGFDEDYFISIIEYNIIP
jgi:hypothetical protein